MNSVGQYAFLGRLVGDGTNTANNQGIWAGDATNAPQLVMRLGDHAPGTQDGVVFFPAPGFGFDPTPWLFNDQGHIAFNAILSGSGVSTANDSGIWSSGPAPDGQQLDRA